MDRFRNAHRWLLLPFGIAILGFAPSYWLRFPDAPWRQHLHGLTATLWFVVLVLQPWLATRGKLAHHRLLGLLALMLAGGVVISALGAIPYNLVNERMDDAGRYGLSFIDVILVAGFTNAVAMAVVRRRNLDDHARWMLSTVFWSVFPGLFRLSFLPLAILSGGEIPFGPEVVMAGMGAINLVVIGILMLRDRRAHPAYALVAVGSLVYFIPNQVAATSWWRAIADALFKI